MNISSILITIVGILIIIGLYVMSRIGQSNMPKNETSILPKIRDKNGDEFTSVLDDIPASDGSIPTPKTKQETKIDKKQVVLFISAENDQMLDGDLIKQTLTENELSFGDNDIYHYQVETSDNDKNNDAKNNQQEPQLSSLFRIANGVEPWTLTDQDLDKKKLVGLSMVMLLPTVIDKKTALKIFFEKADKIAAQINGVLKNQQQQILSAEDRAKIIKD